MLHVIVRAIVVKDGKVLACRSPRGPYYLLGGHVEVGESMEQALHRELQEELGLPGKVQRFLGCLETHAYQPNTHDCHYLHSCHTHEYQFLFLVDVPGLTADTDPQSPEKGLVLAWLPVATLEQLHLQPHIIRTLLPAWLKNNHGGAFAQFEPCQTERVKHE